MSRDHMKNFNEYFMSTIVETVAQKIQVFNQASAGAIVLSSEGFVGDFLQTSFYRSLESGQREVSTGGANSAVTAIDLSQQQINTVKVMGALGPIRYEPSQMAWLEKPTQEGIAVVSNAFSDIYMKDMLNRGLLAAVAAIENNTDAVHDVSATAGLTYSAMNSAHAKFGDASGSIVASIMNGATAHKLIGDNLANAERLYNFGGVTVIDILGKAVIITDAPALFEAGTPSKAKILGLVQGGLKIDQTGAVNTNIDTANGKERLETTIQSEYTFAIGLDGYSWNIANGGHSPKSAKLGTGANWDKVMASVKHSAGVLTIGDANK
ncbi:major capsid protein [Pseudochrobactrum sp. MP213Fo]|uniref:major capsid protein n=1 Tax=Pseudochrobactrum sp. MP213Fo TaxID=3022250 RepID=UPI003B9F9AFB